MTHKLTRTIAPMLLVGLLATAASAAEDREIVNESKKTVVAERMPADTANSANTRAVKAAIEAVLAENKIDLDIRFNGRTSLTTVDGP